MYRFTIVKGNMSWIWAAAGPISAPAPILCGRLTLKPISATTPPWPTSNGRQCFVTPFPISTLSCRLPTPMNWTLILPIWKAFAAWQPVQSNPLSTRLKTGAIWRRCGRSAPFSGAVKPNTRKCPTPSTTPSPSARSNIPMPVWTGSCFVLKKACRPFILQRPLQGPRRP